jgi:hypothetical protein
VQAREGASQDPDRNGVVSARGDSPAGAGRAPSRSRLRSHATAGTGSEPDELEGLGRAWSSIRRDERLQVIQERKLGRIISVHGPRRSDAAWLAGAHAVCGPRLNGSQPLPRAARSPAGPSAVKPRGMRLEQNAVDRVGNRQRQNLGSGAAIRART